jgi:hypothetical protein
MIGPGADPHGTESVVGERGEVVSEPEDLRRQVASLVRAEEARREAAVRQQWLTSVAVFLMLVILIAGVWYLSDSRPPVYASLTVPADVAKASVFQFAGGGPISTTFFAQAQMVEAGVYVGVGPEQTLDVQLPVSVGTCATIARRHDGACELSMNPGQTVELCSSVSCAGQKPALLDGSTRLVRSLKVYRTVYSAGGGLAGLALQSSGSQAAIRLRFRCLTATTLARVIGHPGQHYWLDCVCGDPSYRCHWLTLRSRFDLQPPQIVGWSNLALLAQAQEARTTLAPVPWLSTVAFMVGGAITDLDAQTPPGTTLLLASHSVTQFRLNYSAPTGAVFLATSRATDAQVQHDPNLVESQFDRLGGFESSYFLTVVGILVPIMLAVFGPWALAALVWTLHRKKKTPDGG